MCNERYQTTIIFKNGTMKMFVNLFSYFLVVQKTGDNFLRSEVELQIPLRGYRGNKLVDTLSTPNRAKGGDDNDKDDNPFV